MTIEDRKRRLREMGARTGVRISEEALSIICEIDDEDECDGTFFNAASAIDALIEQKQLEWRNQNDH